MVVVFQLEDLYEEENLHDVMLMTTEPMEEDYRHCYVFVLDRLISSFCPKSVELHLDRQSIESILRHHHRNVKIEIEEEPEILENVVNDQNYVVLNVHQHRLTTDLEEVFASVKTIGERRSAETSQRLDWIWIYWFSQDYCATKTKEEKETDGK